MDAALVVGMVELFKWVIRDLYPTAPDWVWPILAIAVSIGLEIGTDGMSWNSVLAGIRLGLTVSGLYRAVMHVARGASHDRESC